jgi:hypothetical protein
MECVDAMGEWLAVMGEWLVESGGDGPLGRANGCDGIIMGV